MFDTCFVVYISVSTFDTACGFSVLVSTFDTCFVVSISVSTFDTAWWFSVPVSMFDTVLLLFCPVSMVDTEFSARFPFHKETPVPQSSRQAKIIQILALTFALRRFLFRIRDLFLGTRNGVYNQSERTGAITYAGG